MANDNPAIAQMYQQQQLYSTSALMNKPSTQSNPNYWNTPHGSTNAHYQPLQLSTYNQYTSINNQELNSAQPPPPASTQQAKKRLQRINPATCRDPFDDLLEDIFQPSPANEEYQQQHTLPGPSGINKNKLLTQNYQNSWNINKITSGGANGHYQPHQLLTYNQCKSINSQQVNSAQPRAPPSTLQAKKSSEIIDPYTGEDIFKDLEKILQPLPNEEYQQQYTFTPPYGVIKNKPTTQNYQTSWNKNNITSGGANGILEEMRFQQQATKSYQIVHPDTGKDIFKDLSEEILQPLPNEEYQQPYTFTPPYGIIKNKPPTQNYQNPLNINNVTSGGANGHYQPHQLSAYNQYISKNSQRTNSAQPPPLPSTQQAKKSSEIIHPETEEDIFKALFEEILQPLPNKEFQKQYNLRPPYGIIKNKPPTQNFWSLNNITSGGANGHYQPHQLSAYNQYIPINNQQVNFAKPPLDLSTQRAKKSFQKFHPGTGKHIFIDLSEETLQSLPNKKRKYHKAQQEAQFEEKDDYQKLLTLNDVDLVTNVEKFVCPICFSDFDVGEGVTLHECLHSFCKQCLAGVIQFSETPEVKCPFMDDSYSCEFNLQDREIKSLVTPEVYEKHLQKSLTVAESQAKNSFHCKTPDCPGWCLFEDNVNTFFCSACMHRNCLTCAAIHEGQNCREYQDHIALMCDSNEEARKTIEYLQVKIKNGEAMKCPRCRIVILDKSGCDWIQCTMCYTEICWATKGPRWGPGGKGDTSGGCMCKVNGIKCHPKCGFCH